MFKVKSKTNGKIYTVYGVSGPLFLVWNADHWEWMDMAEFKPWGTSE